jgi:trimeric autotransporter adhesin
MTNLFRMYRPKSTPARPAKPTHTSPSRPPMFESLESRRLLSASTMMHSGMHEPTLDGAFAGNFAGTSGGPFGAEFHTAAPAVSEVAFSLLPSTIQSGLTTLATTDGVTAPSSTTEVYLGNQDGVETYTVHETGTGTSTTLTVDSTGKAVTSPTESTTTFGAITSTAVTSELSSIASALSLTAPTSTSTVHVSTSLSGSTTYSIALTSSSTSTSGYARSTVISVDSSGNPVGNESIPLSVLSTAIQTALKSNAPTGAAALTSTSLISVQTIDGVTLYTAHYSSTGTETSVTVNSAGKLTSKPTSTTVDYSTLPTAAKTELQTLATAKGVTTAIASTQSVTETTEPSGTVLYTVQLAAASTTDSTDAYPITLTVDASGNSTVLGALPGFGGIFGGGGFC